MRAIGSPVNNDYDLDNSGSGANVYSTQPDVSNARWVAFDVAIGDGTKNLDGTGGDFTLTVTIGSNVFDGAVQTKTVAASQTRVRFQTIPLIVPANATVTINLVSPNSNDNDVDVTVQPYDVAPLQPSVVGATQVVQTGDTYDRLGEPDGASVSADIAAAKTVIDTVATDVTKVPKSDGSVAFNSTAVAGIQSGLATSAEVTGLNINTRANLSVPVEIETPDSSTQVYKIRLFLFDMLGNMEAPDAEPTITLVNASGTDRSSRLSAATNPSTGVYSWDYTATVGDAEEQLNWTFIVVESSITRQYPAVSYVVEESAYRFSSTDRANLGAVKTRVELALPAYAPAGANGLPTVNSSNVVKSNVKYIDDFGVQDDGAGHLVVKLADDAITASKFDESTAFPLKAADTGSTYIARTGADGDTLETLSDQLDGLAMSSGSGGFTLTITVNDGTNNLQNALVRVKEGVTDLRVLTNSSGQAIFSVDAATYNIYITKSGYQFTPTTLAVSADASQTYSMTAVAITPSAENTVTGYHICYDSSANPKAGVTHTLIQLTPGTLSASYDSTPREVNSAVSTGLVRFTGLHVGATYKYTRGDTKKHTTFTVPTDVEDTWEMDSVVGSP